MDKRLDATRLGRGDPTFPIRCKKSKKSTGKKNNAFGIWMNNAERDRENNPATGMEYQHVLWPSGGQQSFPSDGQRLFTATSDPSVCDYAPLHLPYTMEPVSLPTMYRLYQPVPVSNVRTIHGRPRRHCNQNHRMEMGISSIPMANGYASLREARSGPSIPPNHRNGEYASLPPSANKNNGPESEDITSEQRRYSDPGLVPSEAPCHDRSDDSDSIDGGSSITTIGRGNKLVLSLIEQMAELKNNNSELFKELSETRSELEGMKIKLIQYKHGSTSDYEPGMFSDFVREMRETSKSCELGLLAKLNSTIQEKYNESSAEMEKLKAQLVTLIKEKEESDRRLSTLEEEVSALKLHANNEGREIAAFEEETLALRRELQEARASRTLAENHVAKLEKLVGILRKKMNDARDAEADGRMRDLLGAAPLADVGDLTGTGDDLEQGASAGKRSGAWTSSFPPEGQGQGQGQGQSQRQGESREAQSTEGTDGPEPNSEVGQLPGHDSTSSPTKENSINLSGPVTDL